MQEHSVQPAKYARAAQVAAHFNIGKSTLWLWVKIMPDFPQPMRVGRRVTLFDINAIEIWMKAQEVTQ